MNLNLLLFIHFSLTLVISLLILIKRIFCVQSIKEYSNKMKNKNLQISFNLIILLSCYFSRASSSNTKSLFLVTATPKNIFVQHGTTFTLECIFSGEPAPTVLWIGGNGLLFVSIVYYSVEGGFFMQKFAIFRQNISIMEVNF